jgi:hypothetical protein
MNEFACAADRYLLITVAIFAAGTFLATPDFAPPGGGGGGGGGPPGNDGGGGPGPGGDEAVRMNE